MTADTFQQAKESLQAHGYFKLPKWREQQTRADRTGALDDLLLFEKAYIRRLREVGIPAFSHCIMRGDEQQLRLYQKGVSKALPGQSPHKYGCALDVIHSIHGWNLPDSDKGRESKCWEVMRHIGFEVADSIGVEMVNGGDFESLWDPAHWELKNWRDHKVLPNVPTETAALLQHLGLSSG
jgi:hypothetical protein